MVRLENVLQIYLQGVLKMDWRCLEKVFARHSWTRFEDILEILATWLEDVLQTSWRRLENYLNTLFQHFMKAYDPDEYIGLDQDFLKTSWRRMTQANIFALIKTSWRHLLTKKTKDFFMTPLSRWIFAGKFTCWKNVKNNMNNKSKFYHWTVADEIFKKHPLIRLLKKWKSH